MRILTKASLAAMAGLAGLLGAASAASAHCDNCTYQTYYRPVVVRHCVHVVPHRVYRPEAYVTYRPVVSYQAERHVRYVPETYYSRYTTTERVGGYGGGYYGRSYGYRDSSYGLSPEE